MTKIQSFVEVGNSRCQILIIESTDGILTILLSFGHLLYAQGHLTSTKANIIVNNLYVNKTRINVVHKNVSQGCYQVIGLKVKKITKPLHNITAYL